MRSWLPFPLLTVITLVMWLVLNESVALGTVILGSLLAFAVPSVLAHLDPPKGSFRRPITALKLMLIVFVEIVRSNDAVARIVLGSGRRDRRSGFVRIPLDTRNPYSLTTLACIVTATPGTIWVEYDSAQNIMLLHVLDLISEEQWVMIIKERYERRLMEVFG